MERVNGIIWCQETKFNEEGMIIQCEDSSKVWILKLANRKGKFLGIKFVNYAITDGMSSKRYKGWKAIVTSDTLLQLPDAI